MNPVSNKIELLAPVGDAASFIAALKNGADAVYLGAKAFGARSSAGFDDEALGGLIRTAHLYGRRVHVAVNTLIKQRELPEAERLLHALDRLGADAVIVQDLGLLRTIKERLPHLPVHASTQMSIHHAAGARMLMDQGVQRVVLARECSLDTMAQVAATGIQTEVFVHGALCISVSGQCLLSSQIGGRSGNRGRCAQPCRMQYAYRGEQGAWLSPRDIAQVDNIPQLAAAGVGSLKIEGRLKRPEYVAVVTGIYRRALDDYYEGRFQPDDPHRMAELLQIYNRGGFTPGWPFGQTDAQIINPLRVSHDGTPLGQVQNAQRKGSVWLSQVQLTAPLHDGDHLQIRGDQEQEMIYAGPDATPGVAATIRHHKPAKAGDRVFKLSDAVQLRRARESTQAPFPPLAVDAHLTVSVGQPAQLAVAYGDVSFTARGDVPLPAQTRPMTKESTEKAIRKTGDSPFIIGNYVFTAEDDCFLPISSLNALRRNALAELEERIVSSYQRASALPRKRGNSRPSNVISSDAPALYVRCHQIDWLPALRQAGADHFLYAPQDYTQEALAGQCARLTKDDYFCLPRQTTDETLHHLADLAAKHQLSVLIDNAGQLEIEWPARLIAGPGVPAWNREALAFLRELGCSAAVLSAEQSREEAIALMADAMPVVLPVYGRAAVMQLNHCPERTHRQLSGDKRSCRLCAAGEGTLGRSLTDRLGAVYPLFPIRLPEGCLNTLLFHRPLNLSRKAVGTRWLLDFTTEGVEEAIQLTRYYAELLKGQVPLTDPPVPVYTGRFEEGVL